MKFDAFPVELIDRFDVRLDAIFRSDIQAFHECDALSISCCDSSFRDASRWILVFPGKKTCRISVSPPREARRLVELVRENGTVFPLLTVLNSQQAELKLLHFASPGESVNEPFPLFTGNEDPQKPDPGDKTNSGKNRQSEKRHQKDFLFFHAGEQYVFLLPNLSSSFSSSPCWLYAGDGFRQISLTGNPERLTFDPQSKPERPLSRELRALIPVKVPKGIQIGNGNEDTNTSFAVWPHFLRALVSEREVAVQGGNASGYWKIWRRYLAIEKRNLFFDLRKKGWLPFHEPRPAETGSGSWIVSLVGPISEGAKKELGTARPGNSVRLVFWEKRPGFLLDSDHDSEPSFDNLFEVPDKQKIEETMYEVTGFDELQSILTLNKQPPEVGGFSFDCGGDLIQWKRKREALGALLLGASVNPRIAKLFMGMELPRAVPGNIPWSSAETMEMLRSENRKLNESQKDAIAIALNTPDIALIQGPPGTGKTTVVSVLLQRLFERFRSEGRQSGTDHLRGRVLLSGFQHDAVENLVDHIKLVGLPVPKFGNRHADDRGNEEFAPEESGNENADTFKTAVNDWSKGICDALGKKYPEIEKQEERDKLGALLDIYRQGPSETTASALLAAIRDSDDFANNPDIAEEAEALLDERTHHNGLRSGGIGDELRRLVWNLRTTPEGFADDGPDCALAVAEALQGELEPQDAELLTRASCLPRGRVPDDSNFLPELSAVRLRLLVSLLDPPAFAVARTDERVLRLAQKAERLLRQNDDEKPVLDAVYRFWRRLRDDPYGVMDAISDYSYAFAATCQQSVNPRIVRQKGASKEAAEHGDFQQYDYVIIDEAARPTALDLLVAAVQGKRVVLVGDHRQLGTVTDEDILGKLQADISFLEEEGDESPENCDSAIDELRGSFFEWLLKPLKQVERQDCIPRFAMLNEQYRMHPVLGSFICSQFYEGKLDSPRPACDFVHNLSGTGGHPAIWQDVRIGACEPDGTSFSRASEANAILDKIVEWNDFHGTIGVISFYKAQADCIQDRLTEFFDGKLPDNIQVGTVDAFQGREFDVVFLSVVRTPAEARGRHPFGCLESPNRLNVAMSRQKKLLVVVGHSGLLDLSDAKDRIPALVEFKKLCDRFAGEGGRQ